jgi:hypothetical protein
MADRLPVWCIHWCRNIGHFISKLSVPGSGFTVQRLQPMDTAHYINQNLEYPSYPTRINRENELKFSEQPALLVKKYFATKRTKINSKQLKGETDL